MSDRILGRRPVPPLERFNQQFVPEPNSGCWLWTGSVNQSGYGQIEVGKKNCRAHRFAWLTHRGEIPPGMVLDHICRTRSCVNPDHLRPVSVRENVLHNSLGVTAKHALSETCSRGHRLVETNCVRSRLPHRICRICQNRRSREWRQGRSR